MLFSPHTYICIQCASRARFTSSPWPLSNISISLALWHSHHITMCLVRVHGRRVQEEENGENYKTENYQFPSFHVCHNTMLSINEYFIFAHRLLLCILFETDRVEIAKAERKINRRNEEKKVELCGRMDIFRKK